MHQLYFMLVFGCTTAARLTRPWLSRHKYHTKHGHVCTHIHHTHTVYHYLNHPACPQCLPALLSTCAVPTAIAGLLLTVAVAVAISVSVVLSFWPHATLYNPQCSAVASFPRHTNAASRCDQSLAVQVPPCSAPSLSIDASSTSNRPLTRGSQATLDMRNMGSHLQGLKGIG